MKAIPEETNTLKIYLELKLEHKPISEYVSPIVLLLSPYIKLHHSRALRTRGIRKVLSLKLKHVSENQRFILWLFRQLYLWHKCASSIFCYNIFGEF